jgi:Fe-S-cluster containining protein
MAQTNVNESPNLVQCALQLDFVCRGCGARCCSHRSVSLSPMDFWRMAWHIQRRRLKPALCYMLIDEPSGLPVLWMAGEPCQYLVDVNQMGDNGQAQATGQQWCGIWKERPNECRAYPVVMDMENQNGNEVLVVRHIEKCAGFNNPVPLRENRSIYQYVRGQIGEERWIEVFLYAAALIPQLRTLGLYWEGAGGRLTEKEVLILGTKLLYRKPLMSPDPSVDHDVVIELLSAQVEFIQKGGWQRWISPFGMDVPAQARQTR